MQVMDRERMADLIRYFEIKKTCNELIGKDDQVKVHIMLISLIIGPRWRDVLIKKYKKRYEYVCDKKKGGMIQSRLYFLKTTPKTTPNNDVGVTAGRAGSNDLPILSTRTEGQRDNSSARQAGKVVNEK